MTCPSSCIMGDMSFTKSSDFKMCFMLYHMAFSPNMSSSDVNKNAFLISIIQIPPPHPTLLHPTPALFPTTGFAVRIKRLTIFSNSVTA